MDYTGSKRKLDGFKCENCGQLLGDHYGGANEAICNTRSLMITVAKMKSKRFMTTTIHFRNKALEKIYLDLPEHIQKNFAKFLIRFFVR